MQKIEENNRLGKTRDLFKKNHRYQGNMRCKMGSIKDRNGMDLTEALRILRILRKGGKKTQKNCTKKDLMTWITMMVWSLT